MQYRRDFRAARLQARRPHHHQDRVVVLQRKSTALLSPMVRRRVRGRFPASGAEAAAKLAELVVPVARRTRAEATTDGEELRLRRATPLGGRVVSLPAVIRHVGTVGMWRPCIRGPLNVPSCL